MTRERVVALSGAGKRYRWNGPWVLDDVSVELAAGSVVELRGANGSGKSTLMRLLAGASAPTRGSRTSADRLTVGYAPESIAPPPFTARQYLGHHVRLRRTWPDRQGEQTTDEVVSIGERLGCHALMDERMAALSKGSLRKIVLVQALLGSPGLLVLDEAFDGLDSDARQSLQGLIEERRARGASVVLSGHGSETRQRQPDAVWRLEGGAVQTGAAEAEGQR